MKTISAPELEENFLEKECYYIVTDETRRDILLSRTKATNRIMTLRQFCERGLSIYSDRAVITRSKELALLSSVISKSSAFGRDATTAIYRLMDELSRNFAEIEPENEKLMELKKIISEHYSYLGKLISRTMIEREALELMKSGKWFPMRRVYLERYPVTSRVENEVAEAIDSMAELLIVLPEEKNTEHYFSFADPDEELEFVAREVIKAYLEGTPFESIAVITPGADYLPLIDEMLEEYSIPHTMYPYTLLRDTKIFEFISQLITLIKDNFRVMDVINLFSTPLVHYKSVNRKSLREIESLLTSVSGGGIDEIERETERTADDVQIAKDLVEALKKIESSSFQSLMSDLNLRQSLFEGASYAEDSLRREVVAYRRVVEAIGDLTWAGKLTGEDVSLESIADILYNANDSLSKAGGVAVLLDKSGFWGGFKRTFYCGVNVGSIFPEENMIINEREAKKLGILDRKKSAELRKEIVLANIRDTVSCIPGEGGFTLFDVLGLNLRQEREERNIILSKTDFEHTLAKRPKLIDFAERYGIKIKIEDARRCIESRDHNEADGYNGKLKQNVELYRSSIGALEDYVRCPFYFFAMHILKLRAKERDRRSEWGEIVHSALKELYSADNCIDEELLALKSTPLFEKRGMEKIERSMQSYLSDPYMKVKIRRALKNSFSEFLRIENGIASRPIVVEQQLSKEICSTILNGRVDRVDIESGRVVVYDYKTGGGVNPGDKSLMQLPLYLYMVDGHYGGGYYYMIGDEEKGGKIVERADFFKDKDVHEVVNEVVEEKVPAILRSIRNGFFLAAPDKNTQKNCDFCRVKRACYTRKKIAVSSPFEDYVKRVEK